MTTDDILRMAREAGASVYKNRHYIDRPFNTFNPEQLERFFRLAYAAGAAAEREECAKVCEAISTDKWALYKGHKPYTGQEPGRAADFTQGQSDGAELCEQAIRARGKT